MLDWIKGLEDEVGKEKWDEMERRHKAARGDKAADLHFYDDQLYNLLSLACTDTALSTVKNCRECFGIRGSLRYLREGPFLQLRAFRRLLF